jgi:hypothetical protein
LGCFCRIQLCAGEASQPRRRFQRATRQRHRPRRSHPLYRQLRQWPVLRALSPRWRRHRYVQQSAYQQRQIALPLLRRKGANERDQFTAKFSDPKNFGPEYGPSDRDRRHRFSAFGLWNLPWGFSWSNTFTVSSATPRSLLCNFDANGDSFSDNDRVFTDGKGNYSCGPGGVGHIVDLGNGKTATLVGALNGGHDIGRNTLRKRDQFFDWSMRIQKDFHIHDRLKISPSAEIFNIVGSDNLRFPVCGELRGCFDGTFLQIPGDPRRARLGLRLEW